MKFERKDIISMRDLSKEEILHILNTAEELEKNPQPRLLEDKILATLFFEPSTRTRLSFCSAMYRLGGKVLGFDSDQGTSAKKGESLADTIRMAECYADVIVIRNPKDGSARLAAETANIPVINAGDGSNQHPSQTLLDLYTIRKLKNNLENLKIGFVGDLKYGRTVHSLSKALSHFGAEMYFIAPDELQMPDYILEDLDEQGITYHMADNFEESLHEYDIMYMTRIQKERFVDEMEYERVKGTFRISQDDIIGKCKKDMKIMHPLPRVDEIAIDLDETEHAVYFEQAKNGIPVRQALLALTLKMV